MKAMKKILALVIGMIMVMGITAMAAETGNTLTITGGKKGHTYTAYKIFSGKVETKDGKDQLTEIQWGNGVSESFQTAKGIAAAYAETLTTDAQAKALAKEIVDTEGYLGTASKSATASADGEVEITGLDDGYYVIVDTVGEGAEVGTTGDVYSQYLVELVKSTTIATKQDVPKTEKKVKDDDYTANDGPQKTGVDVGQGYNDAADYDIGDSVPFELIGTLPSNYGEYTTYKYTFTDTASAGLDIDEDSVVISGTTAVATTTVSEDKHSLIVDFANLKTDTTLTSESKIIVKFNATLNKNAVIGLDGNFNKVTLTYSNNPNKGGEGDTSTTPEDEVLVFTYELDVNKVDGSNTDLKLKDAEFVLSKDCKYVKIDADGKVDGWVTAADAEAASKITGCVLKSNNEGFFKVVGLDAGTYVLTETKAPKGYNLLDAPITVEVIATQSNLQNYKDSEVDTAGEVLTALKIKIGDKEAAGDTSTGIVSTTVTNNSGTELPHTGGMGTTIFYIIGAILVIGAGILLVSKKRMSAN